MNISKQKKISKAGVTCLSRGSEALLSEDAAFSLEGGQLRHAYIKESSKLMVRLFNEIKVLVPLSHLVG